MDYGSTPTPATLTVPGEEGVVVRSVLSTRVIVAKDLRNLGIKFVVAPYFWLAAVKF